MRSATWRPSSFQLTSFVGDDRRAYLDLRVDASQESSRRPIIEGEELVVAVDAQTGAAEDSADARGQLHHPDLLEVFEHAQRGFVLRREEERRLRSARSTRVSSLPPHKVDALTEGLAAQLATGVDDVFALSDDSEETTVRVVGDDGR